MFNNRVQNEKSEFENFLEGPNKKMKLGIGRRIYCDYSFYISTKDQDRIVNVLSLVSKRNESILIQYSMIENEHLNNTKVSVQIVFEDVPKNQKDCLLYVAGYILQIKEILDPFANTSLAREFGMSCSFGIRSLEKYNTVIVEFTDDKEQVEYKDIQLPKQFTKCTTHVNYTVTAYNHIIIFKAYTGNINNRGLSNIFFEMANTMIQFNNEVILRIKD